MTKSIFKLLLIASIFLFFYFSNLYFFENSSFYIPLILSIVIFLLLFLIDDSGEFFIRMKFALEVLVVIFSLIALYVLYKVFYLNLGYSL